MNWFSETHLEIFCSENRQNFNKSTQRWSFYQHSLLNENTNTKKRKAQELWSVTSCLEPTTGVGHLVLSCAAKITPTCALATSPHLLPPMNNFTQETVGWDETEQTTMQGSTNLFFFFFFGLWTKDKAGSSYSLLFCGPGRSISAHYLTDMTVVLRSSAADTQHPGSSSCCFSLQQMQVKKNPPIVRILPNKTVAALFCCCWIIFQSRAPICSLFCAAPFQFLRVCVCVCVFSEIRLKYSAVTELLVTLQQQTQTCCQGLLRNRWCDSTHKRERKKEEGATEWKREEKKKNWSGKSIKLPQFSVNHYNSCYFCVILRF